MESGKLKLNLKGGTPWIEKKKKKKKSKAPEVDTVTDAQEAGPQEGKAGPTTTSKLAPTHMHCHVIGTSVFTCIAVSALLLLHIVGIASYTHIVLPCRTV